MNPKLLKRQEVYFYILTNLYLIINIYYLINSNKLINKIVLFLLACSTLFKMRTKNIDYIERYFLKIKSEKKFIIFTYSITSIIFIFKIIIVKIISMT